MNGSAAAGSASRRDGRGDRRDRLHGSGSAITGADNRNAVMARAIDSPPALSRAGMGARRAARPTAQSVAQTPRGAESSSPIRMRSRIERIPTTLSPSTTGRCRKPPWIIRAAACASCRRARWSQGPWSCTRRRLRRRGGRATARIRSRSVMMPRAPAVEHEHRSDVALDHLLSDLRDRLARLDAQKIGRHVVGPRAWQNSMSARSPRARVSSPSPNSRECWSSGEGEVRRAPAPGGPARSGAGPYPGSCFARFSEESLRVGVRRWRASLAVGERGRC